MPALSVERILEDGRAAERPEGATTEINRKATENTVAHGARRGSRPVVALVVESARKAGCRSCATFRTVVLALDRLPDASRRAAAELDKPVSRPALFCFFAGSRKPGCRSRTGNNTRSVPCTIAPRVVRKKGNAAKVWSHQNCTMSIQPECSAAQSGYAVRCKSETSQRAFSGYWATAIPVL